MRVLLQEICSFDLDRCSVEYIVRSDLAFMGLLSLRNLFSLPLNFYIRSFLLVSLASFHTTQNAFQMGWSPMVEA